MADRQAKIKISAETKEAEANVRRLGKAVAELNDRATGRAKPQLPPGIDKERLAEYKRTVDQLRRIDEANAKAQIRQAEHTAKTAAKLAAQATIEGKKSELRQFESIEKAKYRQTEISAKAQVQAANNAFKAQEAAKKREYQDFVRLEREKTRAAQAEARKRASRDIGGGIQGAGGGIQSAGVGISATLTAPLVALATFGVKSALELDKVRTKLIALEGDAAKADERLQKLRTLADKSVGVTQRGAIETYTQLKGLGGIAEETINRTIVAMGKLNSAFKIEDSAGFIQNLNQIFTQGFERADIKEAIGRVPFFEQLLEQAFGTKDGKKLKALKESGKLTLDRFLTGMSEAINKDPRVANIGENLSVKLEKAFERLNVALAPLGNVILQTVVPAIEQLAPYIQKAGEYFSSLSPNIQLAVVAFGAFLAAVGPALVILGSLVIAIGSVASALGTIAGAIGSIGLAPLIAILAGVGAALAGVGVAAYALYQAWTQNIGGIQQTTAEVFNDLRTLIEPAVAEVSEFIQESFSDVISWVDANLPLMIQTVQTVIAGIRSLWAEHGEQIKAVVSAAWNIVKTIITTVGSQIGNAILLVMNLINGNWGAAWENFKAIIKAAMEAGGAILKSLAVIVWQSLKDAAIRIYSFQTEFYKAAFNIGKNIVEGLANGISNLAESVYDKAKSVASNALNMIAGVFRTQSPSKATQEIGAFVGEGLALGIEGKAARVKKAAKKLADETIKELNEAFKAFKKVAGLSPEQAQRKAAAESFREATSNIDEIIKLRTQTGRRTDEPIPTTIAGVSAELKYLQRVLKETEDRQKSFEDSMENLQKTFDDSREAAKKAAEDFENFKEKIAQRGATDALNISKEIDLLGVTDEMERQRIENYYEIQKLRQDMTNDGYGQQQIDEATEILQVEQGRSAELQRILQIRRQVVEAGSLEKTLLGDLAQLQNGGRELTEYEKTLQKINQDLKDIDPAQKEYLLNLAAQIDAQRQFNEAYKQTYDFIRDSLDVLTDDSMSFGEKLKTIFGSIANSFKKMLLDMAASWLTNKLFGTRNGQSGGFLQNIFGGGGSSGGGSIPIIGFGGDTGLRIPINNFSGGAGGGIFNFNGSSENVLNQIRSIGGNSNIAGNHEGGHVVGLPGGGFRFGNNVGTYGAIGAGAGILGSLIGGRTGRMVSGAGMGLALGAQLGSSVPGIGTAIGAGVGAAAGFLLSLFGGDKNRKQDKKENIPALQKGFTDSLAQLRQLLTETQAGRINPPESALTQAQEIRAQIANSFGINFKSKKYKRIAAGQIVQKLSEADNLIKQLEQAVARAAQAREFSNKFVATFADGGAVSQFASLNKLFSGRVPGTYDRKDDRLIRVSGDEVVLTPKHWRPITPYLQQMQVPGFANGGFVGSSSPAQPVVYVDVHISNKVGVTEENAAEIIRVGAKTSTGQTAVVGAVRVHVDEVGVTGDGLPRDLKKAERS